MIAAACSKDAPLTPPAAGSSVRLSISAQSQATTATAVQLRATYIRVNGEEADVEPAQTLPLTGTSTTLRFTIALDRCLSDGRRGSSGCDLTLEITLLRGTTVLDVQRLGPFVATPGGEVTVSNPVVLHEVSRVRITSSQGDNALAITPGDTLLLLATAFDVTNAPVPGKTATWTSASPAVATVVSANAGTGRVVAVTPGTAVIRAVAGAREDSVTVTVAPPTPSSINVILNATSIEIGEATQSVGTVLDQRGRPIAGSTVSWSAATPSVATVAPATGVVTGVSVGTTDIVASSGSITGRATVTVIIAAAHDVAIAPTGATVPRSGTFPLSATVRDKRGSPLTGRVVTWSSLNAAIATVSASGVVTGVALGSVGIVASVTTPSGVASDTAVISVVTGGTLAINSVLLGGTTIPAPIDSIAGVIDVLVDYTTAPGLTATRMDLLLNGAIAGSVVPSASTCPALRCRVALNTAAFDAITGAASYTNGIRPLVAILTLSDASSLVATALALTLQNTSGFTATVQNVNTNAGFPNAVLNSATGHSWIAGDVTLTLLGVSYVAGEAFASVSGSFLGRAFSNIPLLGGTASISFTNVPGTQRSIAGYQTSAAVGDLPLLTSATVTGGGNRPVALLGTPVAVRVDNAAPTGGALQLAAGAGPWISGAYPFSSGLTVPAETGVGLSTPVAVQYQRTGCGSTVWQDFGATGAQLGECRTSTANDVYQARAIVFDRLGNADTLTMATPFAVDTTPPVVSFTQGSYGDQDLIDVSGSFFPISPAFDLVAIDSLSGVQESTVYLSKLSPQGNACVIGSGTPGSRPMTNPACGYVLHSAAVDLPSMQYGFFRYQGVVIDRAGNVSAPMTRSVLVDGFNPSILPPTPPTSPAGGVPLSFPVGISDDSEIQEAGAFVAYDNLQDLFSYPFLGYPVAQPATAFDDVLLSIPQVTMPTGFMRSLEITDYASDTVRSSFSYPVAPTALLVRASDFEWDDSHEGEGIGSFSSVPSGVSWASYNAANPNDRIITFSGVASLSAGPVAGIKAQVVAPLLSTRPPFQRVEFFVLDGTLNGIDVQCFLGVAATPFQVIGPANKTWVYAIPAGTTSRRCAGPGTTSASAGVAVLAVGVSANGDALATKMVDLVP